MVDYSFYIARGSGSIPQEEWHGYANAAQGQLDHYKRVYTVTAPDKDAESLAICAMADAMAFFTGAQNGGAVASTSIGSVSVSYTGAQAVDVSPKAQARELLRCARTYLDIYRGVG